MNQQKYNGILARRSDFRRWFAFVFLFGFSALNSMLIHAKSGINQQIISQFAPKETMQFGQLVGHWVIKDYSLDKNGKWQEGQGANWNFYWILGGSAIQDDWIAPGLTSPEPEGGRQYGTNIRIYNSKTNEWEMAWTSNKGQKVDTFKAVGNEQSIVMRGFYNNAETRITFFNITKQHFSWEMEVQNKDEQWQQVYKIEGKRVKG